MKRILELHDDEPFLSAAGILDRLSADGWSGTERTVQRIIRKHRPTSPTADEPAWYFADLGAMDDDDAAIVMQLMAEWHAEQAQWALDVMRPPVRPRGMTTRPGAGAGPTIEQARWMVRIRRAAPTFPAWRTFAMSRAMAATTDQETRGSLERELVEWMAERAPLPAERLRVNPTTEQANRDLEHWIDNMEAAR